MLRWISLAIVLLTLVLYFTGALEFSDSAKSINITVDKQKAQDLGESLKESLEN